MVIQVLKSLKSHFVTNLQLLTQALTSFYFIHFSLYNVYNDVWQNSSLELLIGMPEECKDNILNTLESALCFYLQLVYWLSILL